MLNCCDCERTANTGGGYLRPEGFICVDCRSRKLEDPAFVREMGRLVQGLVAAVTGSGSNGTEVDQRIPPAHTEPLPRPV
jgi:hypothetical protein